MNAQKLRRIMPSLLKIIALGFAVLAPFGALAQADQAPFIHDESYMLPSGKKVAVKFRERRCTRGECREVDAGVWGMDGGILRLVTEIFSVVIDGRASAAWLEGGRAARWLDATSVLRPPANPAATPAAARATVKVMLRSECWFMWWSSHDWTAVRLAGACPEDDSCDRSVPSRLGSVS